MDDDVLCCSLHPSGSQLLIGMHDKLRLFTVALVGWGGMRGEELVLWLERYGGFSACTRERVGSRVSVSFSPFIPLLALDALFT